MDFLQTLIWGSRKREVDRVELWGRDFVRFPYRECTGSGDILWVLFDSSVRRMKVTVDNWKPPVKNFKAFLKKASKNNVTEKKNWENTLVKKVLDDALIYLVGSKTSYLKWLPSKIRRTDGNVRSALLCQYHPLDMLQGQNWKVFLRWRKTVHKGEESGREKERGEKKFEAFKNLSWSVQKNREQKTSRWKHVANCDLPGNHIMNIPIELGGVAQQTTDPWKTYADREQSLESFHGCERPHTPKI